MHSKYIKFYKKIIESSYPKENITNNKKKLFEIWKKNTKRPKSKKSFYHNDYDIFLQMKKNTKERLNFYFDEADNDEFMDYESEINSFDTENVFQTFEIEKELKIENQEKKNEVLPEDTFYFLKIANELNGCYANSIIQSMLSLGAPIYNVSFKDKNRIQNKINTCPFFRQNTIVLFL